MTLVQDEVCARFRKLHVSGCFVIPNPWDAGSARFLHSLGFPALATTSAGFQYSRGEPDKVRGLSAEVSLEHIASIVAATPLPVNADFQSGYADDSSGVFRNVQRCIQTGVAGLSIEDAMGQPGELYSLSEAVERIKAARRAIDESGKAVLLTARAETYLVGHPQPLKDSIDRLQAYAAAGADVLFAPGARTRSDVETIVKAVAPKPVNVVVMGNMGLSVVDLAEMGVRRVSLGSALARVAWGAFMHAAREITEAGRFDSLGSAASFAELNGIFASYND